MDGPPGGTSWLCCLRPGACTTWRGQPRLLFTRRLMLVVPVVNSTYTKPPKAS
jgi:hypothetical protein